MARDREPEAADTGRPGYLQADESWDGSGRPRVRIVRPFWANESERLDYLFAVESTRDIVMPSVRLEAIRIKLGLAKGSTEKRMPSARMSRRQTDDRLAELREQAGEDVFQPEPEEQWWQK